ncbi:MAG: hypothetical protein COW73_11685 [Nitrospirae bacterium CG18_big_fil_WC_8_21_14_2_50_70_55]|nr:hypothetical protein [Deltaproteobacteria bacterium]OIP64755.1 MAG: hypothetical protein AUK30_06145 [Nitrospirae bacterium CG2_30_70_394]PIQ03136.1 MAG: hypothetical protein COW73_11685 [Nitrospirae bacterium CG18_big_fil_WC_8_21_14_2_50_70_55]PIU78293.1 MAG: hypothetical protein COS73_07480 [Nitrospirae bacterium CG06_land_8_20_14_3_00_70_43]PIW82339.1 MAG: hypothetical protein COZ96_09340 [Nitrospirae bacterium CG_4_8_14_3_um_filter_70_85]PIX83059.1 MAG: hypothetical protein COZ33_07395 
MLTTMRESIRSLQAILWLVIAAFVVTIFYAWGKGGAANNPTGIVAWIDGDQLLYNDYQMELNNLLDSLRQATNGEVDPKLVEQLGLKQRALDNLISRRLLAHAAAEMGLPVSNAELLDTIQAITEFQEGGQFQRRNYDAYLRRQRLAPEQFETNRRELLAGFHLARLVRGTLTVSDTEVAEAYRLQGEQIKVAYCRINPAQLARQVQVDDATLTAFHAAHAERYMVPEQVKVATLTFRPADFEQEVTPSDGELHEAYETHLDRYEVPEGVRARHILLRVAQDADPAKVKEVENKAIELLAKAQEGGDFAALAKQYSEDSTAAQGGDLGEFHRGQMVPAFEEAAFAAQAGEIVGPVQTAFGFHLIQIESHTEGGLRPLEEVREAVRAELVKEQAKALALARGSALQEAISNGGDPNQLANEAKLTWQDAGWLDATSHALPPPVVEAAMANPAGTVTPPVEADGLFYLVRTEERSAARPKSLEEAKEAVRTDLLAERATALASDTARQWIEAIHGGKTLAELAKGLGLMVVEPPPFTRGQPPAPLTALGDVRKAFDLPQDRSALLLDSPGGVAVVEVVKHIAPDPAGLEAAKAELTNQLLTAKHQLAMEVLTARLRDEAQIKLNQKVVARLLGGPASEAM